MVADSAVCNAKSLDLRVCATSLRTLVMGRAEQQAPGPAKASRTQGRRPPRFHRGTSAARLVIDRAQCQLGSDSATRLGRVAYQLHPHQRTFATSIKSSHSARFDRFRVLGKIAYVRICASAGTLSLGIGQRHGPLPLHCNDQLHCNWRIGRIMSYALRSAALSDRPAL